MSNKHGGFALLDSSYNTPQHMQMMTFKNYVAMHNIKLEFYGSELAGTEEKHRIFIDYIESKRYRDYIFFSIRQFLTNNMTLQETLIKRALAKDIVLHFANENRQIRKGEDIAKIKGLLLSIADEHLEETIRNSPTYQYYRH